MNIKEKSWKAWEQSREAEKYHHFLQEVEASSPFLITSDVIRGYNLVSMTVIWRIIFQL